jgi:hypothetical protein
VSRKLYGTRFTTQCGHSWRWRHSKLTVDDMAGATVNCPAFADSTRLEQCPAYLFILPEQFEGMDRDAVPAEVHAVLFHKWLHQQDPTWPEDGHGTMAAEFTLTDSD